MKTEDFVFAMNETADKFITEPFEEAKEGKIIRFRKWAAVAACICLVLASATVVAAEVFDIGFNLLQRERNDRNGTYTAEGYVLDFEIGTHPQESVGAMEEIRNLLNQKKYITIYASNIEPEYREEFIEHYGAEYARIEIDGIKNVQKSFGDKETALEYVGFESFLLPDINFDDEYIDVFVSGYSGNELCRASIYIHDPSTKIDEPNLNFSYSAIIYFDSVEIFTDTIFAGDRGEIFTEERCVNENGTEYLVVKCITAEGRVRTISAFLIKDDILYKAVINSTVAIYEFTENYSNPEDHIDFIHNWANFY